MTESNQGAAVRRYVLDDNPQHVSVMVYAEPRDAHVVQYVLASDYDSISTELAQLKAQVDELREYGMKRDGEVSFLQMQVGEARKALERIRDEAPTREQTYAICVTALANLGSAK